MRILFLSFYFEPDLSAGSFRATELIKSLSKRLSNGDTIHVITTMPNRYHTYSAAAAAHETRGNIKIERIALPAHRSGMMDQAVAFVYFAAGVIRRTRFMADYYDMVFATSSRLMTAMVGALVARSGHAKLYLDLRDIFPDTLSDLFAGKVQRFILPLFRFIERRTLRTAERINLVSSGFVDYFKKIRSDIQYRTFTNGIDEIFLDADYFQKKDGDRKARIILYAGNIGDGQGLDRIVPEAAAKLGPEWEFWIVGDGGARKALEHQIEKLAVNNVVIINPVNQDQLIAYYRRADVLFLHLNDYPAFKKVLPSKIFEYAATGKPLLAGVSGHSRQFIEDHIPNSAVFHPCDPNDMIRGLAGLELKTEKPLDFIDQFRRSTITRRMVADMLDLVK